jgi:hypothetical protein
MTDQPAIQTIPVVDRATWLQHRRQDVTASVAAAVLNAHPYTTAYALWAEKTGRLDGADAGETAAMERGRLLEPVALQLLRERQPTWRVDQPGVYLRDPAARLGATPDAYAVDPERPGFGIVQVKSVEASIFRRSWRDEATREVTLPLWIACQAIIEAHLSGASWACVTPLVIGFGLDMPIIDVPIHSGVIQRIRGAVADFWRLVDSGQTPDFDFGRDAGLISRLYANDDGSTIDLSDRNDLPALLDEKEQLSTVKNDADKRLKAINAELIAAMGTATSAVVANGVVTAKTIHRGAYSVAPTSYRSPRFKRATDHAREAAE